jgi:hypothetical protein
MRTISPRDCRGKVRFVTPKLLEWSSAIIRPDGGYVSGVNYVGAGKDESRWVHLGPPGRDGVGRTIMGQERNVLLMGSSIQFTRHYHWHVSLGYEGGLAINLATDPVGAREVFRLRDIPEGKSRRAALRHWVAHHWRKKHDDPAAEVAVREHLRGATRFAWNGLICEIRPSKDDLNRAMDAKAG